MPFPPDRRVLSLLSVFEGMLILPVPRYSPDCVCIYRHQVYRTRGGKLVATMWTHSCTTWVSLSGLLDRRAAASLVSLLTAVAALDLVMNVAALELPAASGGTPLLSLCAELSAAGHSVTVVGLDDQQATEDDDRPQDAQRRETRRTA